MAKKPTSKPAFKVPNNEKVTEFCHVFVQNEITRGIGAEGAEACLTIGVHLDKVLDAYQEYYRLVTDFAGVDMERVANHFGENWAKMPNAKRRLLEATIRKEVDDTNKAILGHIKYLEMNRAHMNALGPRGSAEVARKMAELAGQEVSMQAQQGGLAAAAA